MFILLYWLYSQARYYDYFVDCLVLTWPLRSLLDCSCVLLTCPYLFFFFLTLCCSLALQDSAGSSSIFPIQVLESATSLDSLGSFYWRTVFRNGSRLFVFPKIHMLNLKPSIMIFEHGAFERWLDGEGRALTKEIPGSSLSYLPHEDRAKGWPCMNKEVGLHQVPNLLTPWSWAFQSQELWEINFCCLKTTQSMVFSYSSPNRLQQKPQSEC